LLDNGNIRACVQNSENESTDIIIKKKSSVNQPEREISFA